MVNPSAARHLALVVGVLLCFFVYMGYHIKSRYTPNASLDDRHALETAGLNDVATTSSSDGSFALMTMREPAGDDRSDSAVTGMSLPVGKTAESDASGQPASGDGPLSLAEGLLAGSGAAAVANGSVEESTGGEGTITGLTADPAPSRTRGSDAGFPSGDRPDDAGLLPLPAAVIAGDDEEPRAGSQPTTPLLDAPARNQTAEPLLARSPSAASPALQPTAGAVPLTIPADRPDSDEADTPEAPASAILPPQSPQSAPQAVRTGETIRTYVIRSGDTLSSIATRELGSIALADNIYLLNRDIIFDPDQLSVGARIRLPAREALSPLSGQRFSGEEQPPAATDRNWTGGSNEGPRLYRVRPGDTLSSIALQFYGSSSGWRFLFESNASTIANPDALPVGVELVIPPYDGGR